MALKVRLTRRAQSDIASIRDYIVRHDPQAAERVRLAIVGAIDLLSERPKTGPMSDEPGVRLKVLTPYPYWIYYRVTADSVVILHVRHTARRGPEPGEI